jgi:hypothetical protein
MLVVASKHASSINKENNEKQSISNPSSDIGRNNDNQAASSFDHVGKVARLLYSNHQLLSAPGSWAASTPQSSVCTEEEVFATFPR